MSVGGTSAINTTTITTSNVGGGTGNQTYTGPVTLGGANGTTIALSNAEGTVAFVSTVDSTTVGQQALSVSNNASFGGVVGGNTALSALSIGGTTAINTTAIMTSNAGGGTGNQTYAGAVTLGSAHGTTAALIAAGGTVAFGSTVNALTAGQQALSVSNNAIFGGVVGGNTALSALSIGGATAINTTAIMTSNVGGGTGNQTYTGAVTLGTGNGTTVALIATGGTVAFGSTVNAPTVGQQALTVSNGASLANKVGARTPIFTALALLVVLGMVAALFYPRDDAQKQRAAQAEAVRKAEQERASREKEDKARAKDSANRLQ